jgi:hypothetical protein
MSRIEHPLLRSVANVQPLNQQIPESNGGL